MAKRWSKAEIAHLKRHAEKHSVEELAQRFHVDSDRVREKLAELGLGSAHRDTGDAALEDFTQGLALLHKHKWKAAAALFEKAAAEAEDLRLADRARQHLVICQRRSEKQDDDADPFLRAVFEKNRGNLDRALELCEQQKAADKEERYAYLMASIRALLGAEDAALALLKTAIELEPRNRVHAYHDPDFESLQGREDFAHLIQAS